MPNAACVGQNETAHLDVCLPFEPDRLVYIKAPTDPAESNNTLLLNHLHFPLESIINQTRRIFPQKHLFSNFHLASSVLSHGKAISMHLNFLPLLSLFTLIWTASQSLAVRTVFPVGNGGAVVNDASGNARVFYQATDGSIHMLSGSGVTNGRNYADSLIIASGVAKSGTPIAAVAPGNDLSKVCDLLILRIEKTDHHGCKKL